MFAELNKPSLNYGLWTYGRQEEFCRPQAQHALQRKAQKVRGLGSVRKVCHNLPNIKFAVLRKVQTFVRAILI